MECMRRKRKGLETFERDQTQILGLWSHFSLEDSAIRKKKCKEGVVSISKIADLCPSVVKKLVVATAPAYGTASVEPPCRGLKRKIGCIDAATRLGRRDKIGQKLEFAGTLGKGKFGSVTLCRSKESGEEFACKTLRKGKEIVHREVEIMQHLTGHPGVVMLKSVYEDEDSFHLVMELCSGGRLLDQMAREGCYSEQKAASIIKELMLAVRYCHEMGVVHRDIKPENVLLTSSGLIKLADFGLAVRILDGQSLTGLVGSPAYVAPEVLTGSYSEKVDIWSTGVLLHALLVGTLPFRGDSLEDMFDAIKNERLIFDGSVWESVSHPARDLMSKMLSRDVSARFSANEVLKHPWLAFYTEPTLTSDALEPKKSNARLTSRTEPCVALGHQWSPDSTLIDVLATAISQVQISEPKRSRVCSPSRAVQAECSSNMNSSNLCPAF